MKKLLLLAVIGSIMSVWHAKPMTEDTRLSILDLRDEINSDLSKLLNHLTYIAETASQYNDEIKMVRKASLLFSGEQKITVNFTTGETFHYDRDTNNVVHLAQAHTIQLENKLCLEKLNTFIQELVRKNEKLIKALHANTPELPSPVIEEETPILKTNQWFLAGIAEITSIFIKRIENYNTIILTSPNAEQINNALDVFISDCNTVIGIIIPTKLAQYPEHSTLGKPITFINPSDLKPEASDKSGYNSDGSGASYESGYNSDGSGASYASLYFEDPWLTSETA